MNEWWVIPTTIFTFFEKKEKKVCVYQKYVLSLHRN